MDLGYWVGSENGRREVSSFRKIVYGGALATLLAVSTAGQADSEQASGSNRVDYEIHARLDGQTKQLTANETVRWTNGSTDEVSTVQFHLYLNAFSNNRSTHLHEAKGKLRGHKLKDGWGWSRITGAKLLSETEGEEQDLFSTLTFIAPDDQREEDRTVFELQLPTPVQPGETIELAIEWESQLPRVRRRTGTKGDFMLVAQWFPKLGVYEGGSGWNTHQFHANTEFYSDYGTYDVTLDLPAEYLGDGGVEPRVGGSGVIVTAELKGDERVMVHMIAPSLEDQRHVDRTGNLAKVHDFTWTADPNFIVHRETFRSSTWANQFPKDMEMAKRAFGPEKDLALHNVDIRVLIQPERADQAERHAHATAAALFFYGLWWGEYPYSEITVVDPAWGGRGAGGMEYPTIFTAGTRMFTTPDMYTPESVTVHEAGHQFWYGLVGNNEFEGAWMDEGFNSYTDSEVMWRVYGPSRTTTTYAGYPIDGERVAALPSSGKLGNILTGNEISIPFSKYSIQPFRASGFLKYWRDQPLLHFVSRYSDPRWGDRRGYLRAPESDPIDTPAWKYLDGSSYGTNSYPRPAVVLRTLRGLVGEVAFLRGMRHYSETWRYKHPYPDDFFAAFQEGSGVEEDLSWYWEDFFRSTGMGDWSVKVNQARESKPHGYFADDETGEFVMIGSVDDEESEDEVAEADGAAGEDEAEEDGPPWVSEVVLRHDGTLYLPLDVRVDFENGEKEEFVWSRESQIERPWTKREWSSQSKIVSVRIDPHHKIWLDSDMSNNQWFESGDKVAPWRWSERAFSQASRVIQWFSRMGG
ncbi:MAG: hypothetical protein ACI8TQ_000594 [Planctomycetota bacterium]|jgi:hypothetical protein